MEETKKITDSKKDIKTPGLLDVPFVQEALHRGGEKNLQVKELTVRAATAPGDNYGSAIYRLNATLADGSERSLIVKMPHSFEGLSLEDYAANGVFRRETAMYKDVLPKMHALLDAAAPGHYSPLSCRCLHHGISPNDILVMEDLVTQGFKLADRHRGLGLRHSSIALRALGRFHAASAAVLERNPSAANELDNPFNKNMKGLDVFVTQAFEGTISACRNWPGFEEETRRLTVFKDNAFENFEKLNEPKPTTFNVILHGDYWMNNMMFQYEDGEPRDVRSFDFQLSHVAPAVLDVVYFLSCSLSEDVSKHHQDLLLREYHRALVEAMDLLGLQPPSLEALQADIASHGAYSLFGTLGVLPLVKAQSVPDMTAIVQGDESASRFLYEDPVVKRWMQRILPEYRAKGWLPG